MSPNQLAFSPGRALAAREGLKRLARAIDGSVGDLWRALDPKGDVLAVVSDHGLVPSHDAVKLNQALADAGLLTIDDSGRRPTIAATSPMAAVTVGAFAHVYLNLRGREPEGVVEPARAEATVQRAARALADIHSAAEPVVERLLTRTDGAAYGLGSPACGDLMVFLYPGFSASSELGGEVVEPGRSYGQHGYLSHHDGMCASFFARGAGLRRSRRDELALTEIGPLLASWLGLSPAR